MNPVLKMAQSRKKLRSGFTTGTAAAAATKAALLYLRGRQAPRSVSIELLTGQRIEIGIQSCRREGNTAVCTVIKDAGDDPDVTHRAVIGAKVTEAGGRTNTEDRNPVLISGGQGVGTVTKPGLEVPAGQPAINPGPRKMIRQAVRDVIGKNAPANTVLVEIFVPRGVELARKTLNARLGIVGGISILGTTGVVRPMSHAAYTATIRAAISVARAAGLDQAVFTTGRRSERYAQVHLSRLAEEAFVQIGDYFQFALQTAAEFDLRSVCLAVFFGKALKMAQGFAHTHAARSRIDFKALAVSIDPLGQRPELSRKIEAVNTARQAFELIRSACPEFIAQVGCRIADSARRFAAGKLAVDVIIFDYQGRAAYDSIGKS